MDSASPLVSVITATYNRSNVLRYAIASVRAQTLTDWEMLVVGDACTDDTAEVVAECNDPRVRFWNLARPAGDQSGPNNEGFRLARGRYIAYLNHDDLWFPDHLATCVGALDETGADLVWPLVVKMRPDGVFTFHGLNWDMRYAPNLNVPASFWVLRREMAKEVGPWLHHLQCYATPSQEWIFRAWRQGRDIRHLPALTAIALPSGGRPGAYASREFEENRSLYERISGAPGFRERLLLETVEFLAKDMEWKSPRSAWAAAVRRSASRLLVPFKLHAQAVELFFRFARRGRFVRFLRRFRGLPPIVH